jgi:hypothetical protein
VQPKALALLLVLVKHHARAVSTRELFEHLWPNEKVGHTSLAKAVYGARLVLGDTGACRTIQTVRGRGYRFTAPVHTREFADRPDLLVSRGPLSSEVRLAVAGRAIEGDDAAAVGKRVVPPVGHSVSRAAEIRLGDGFAVAERGDLFLALCKAPARRRRMQWLFDTADRFAERTPEGFLALIVVLSSSDPPDYPTIVEVVARLSRIRPYVRRQVNVAVGGGIWVRMVESAHAVMQRATRRPIGPYAVVSTLEAAIELIHEVRDARTPSAAEIRHDLQVLAGALDAPQEVRLEG